MDSASLTDEDDHSRISYSIVTVGGWYKHAPGEPEGTLKELILKRKGTIVHYSVVPDDIKEIEIELRSLVCRKRTDVILTVGGVGFRPSDVTPEATLKVIDKRSQALEIAMINSNSRKNSSGLLSRAVCGISSRVLIINLPGSQGDTIDCFEAVAHSLPEAVGLIRNDKPKIRKKTVPSISDDTPKDLPSSRYPTTNEPKPLQLSEKLAERSAEKQRIVVPGKKFSFFGNNSSDG